MDMKIEFYVKIIKNTRRIKKMMYLVVKEM